MWFRSVGVTAAAAVKVGYGSLRLGEAKCGGRSSTKQSVERHYGKGFTRSTEESPQLCVRLGVESPSISVSSFHLPAIKRQSNKQSLNQPTTQISNNTTTTTKKREREREEMIDSYEYYCSRPPPPWCTRMVQQRCLSATVRLICSFTEGSHHHHHHHHVLLLLLIIICIIDMLF
eukprot:gene1185-701_t